MRYQFMRFPGGKSKVVTLSYDDGVRQDLRFSELLNKYGIKCTFNLNSHKMRGAGGLAPEEVKEYLLDKGHEIALHTNNHRAPGTLRPIEAIQDILANRNELEQTFGRIVRGMAYPDSGIRVITADTDYERIRHYLKDLDVAYARTLGGDNDSFRFPEDWYAWMPTAHHGNPQIFNYIEKFLALNPDDPEMRGTRRQPGLFYLWGHSYEFDRSDNGWEHIEKICERLAFQDNIWYATNMEIYEYVTAYRSLIYSADESRIYNPTLHTIWFDADGKSYTIQPGETIVRPV